MECRVTTARLEISDFPRPAVARSLSPNGRVHWAQKHLARTAVHQRVWLEAFIQQLPKMRGLVVIRPTFTYPIERRRDIDNACTGVLKHAIDALVRGAWLVDDSLEYVRLEPPVVCVKPGVRSLVLEFETSDVVTDRQLPSVAESSVPAAQVGSTSQPRGRR